MDTNKINAAIDSAFDKSFKSWSDSIEEELYPDAFANPYSWHRVKESLKINNLYLKNALKDALAELLND